MRLYFLRHGRADRDAWSGTDFARPLTAEGVARLERTAVRLARLGLRPDAILTSPLVRARQTAEIAAAGLGREDRLREDDRLAGGFGPDALAAILADHADAAELLLVGHEPAFSETVGALTGGDVTCKKGSLVRVDLHATAPPAGTLVWLLPPRLLAR